MTAHFVVTNPPHNANVKLEQCTAMLGLTPADVRMKTSYPAPEFWFMDQDRRALEHISAMLGKDGLRCHVLSTQEIVGTGPQRPALDFQFNDASMTVRTDGEDIELPFALSILLVIHAPASITRQRPRRRIVPQAVEFGVGFMGSGLVGSGLESARARAVRSVNKGRERLASGGGLRPESAFVDIYYSEGASTGRVTLTDQTSYAAVGDMSKRPLADNLETVIAKLMQCFPSLAIDDRIEAVNLATRQPVVGEVGVLKVLSREAAALKDVTLADVYSRIAFLTAIAVPSPAVAPAPSTPLVSNPTAGNGVVIPPPPPPPAPAPKPQRRAPIPPAYAAAATPQVRTNWQSNNNEVWMGRLKIVGAIVGVLFLIVCYFVVVGIDDTKKERRQQRLKNMEEFSRDQRR